MREIDRKYSIKRKKHVKTTTFVTLLVAATMILSGAVTGITMIMNEKTTMIANTGGVAPLGSGGDDRLSYIPDEPDIRSEVEDEEIDIKPRGYRAIAWDNGMSYHSMGSTQDDQQYPFLSEMADDFKFPYDQDIQDLHWVGGYWNGDPAPFDWRIRFYDDNGDAPGAIHAGPFEFAWDDIDKIDLGGGYFEMSVDLPESVSFNANTKYWLSIQGVGFFPPQSGWAMHYGIQLSMGMFKSEYFGYPDWTPASVVGWGTVDFCFQLTFKPEHDVGVTEIKHPRTCDSPGCPCIPVEVEVENFGLNDEEDVPVTVEVHRNLLCTSFPQDDLNIEWNFDGDGLCNWQFVMQETAFPYVVEPNKGEWMAEFNQHGCEYGWASMRTHEPLYLCGDCLDPYLKFYMWHDDYGSDDYLDVWISTSGKYGQYVKVGGPYERLCCPDCPIGWKEYRISLAEFICQPIWIMFMGHCDGTPSAYNLHIDDVCVFDAEYAATEYIDIESGEVKQVEFECWETECWWCQYENEDIEFWVGAWTELEGDDNPGNDGFGPCQNAFEQIFIHIPWTHDVGDKEIEFPDQDYYMAGPIKMKQKIKNYGKEPEGCFYVYMAVRDLQKVTKLNEIFSNWDYTGYPCYYTPTGWTEKCGYRGWERDYDDDAGGTSPQARLPYYYAGYYTDDNDWIRSPSINTEGQVKLELEFKSFIDWYYGNNYCWMFVEVTPDGGVSGWTDVTPWSNPISGNVGPDTYLVDITGAIGVDTQVQFRFYGYYWYFDYWYVDDVKLISYTCGDELYYLEKVCIDYIDVCEELNVPFPDFIPEPPEDCYCGTVDYCVESWTKMLDPPDQNTANDKKQTFITVEFLHDVGIVEFTSPAAGVLGEVIFSQPYGDYCTGPFSDAGSGGPYRVYDNFWGLEKDIGDLHWWGLIAYGDDNPAGDTYEIGFFPDDNGMPDMNNPTATFSGTCGAEIITTDTGIDWYGFSLYLFEMVLPDCVSMEEGWLSVYKTTVSGELFAWMDDGAATGDGMAYQHPVGFLGYDVSFELTACEDDDELPEPEVYIMCGEGDLSVLIENFGTYVENPVIVDWELFEYQPAKTSVAVGQYITDLDPGEQEDCLLGTYDFIPGVFELEVEVNLVPPSMDCNLGNNGPETLIIGVDCCEPDACFVLDPEDPDGENNWYVSDVTVTVDAWDTCEVQSGISHIVYIIDGVMDTIPGEHGDFVISGDGVHHCIIYAVDNVGHEGVHHTFEVAIDATDPTIDLVYTKFTDDAGGQFVEFTAIASDDTSGMNRVEFSIDGVLKETITGAGPYVYTVSWAGYDQNTEVKAEAFDDAGNSAYDEESGIKFEKDRSHSQSRSKTLPVSRIILNLGR